VYFCSVKRYEFRLVAEAPQAREGLLVGLALPYGVEASPQHPAFRRGVLVEYDTTKPLLLEHNIRAAVGKVLRVWEEGDGVHFVAKLDKPLEPLPSGLSVGGEYVVNESGEIEALLIHEISLTNSPAYKQTKYSIVATMKAQDITEVQALAQQLQELAQKVQELQAFVEQAQSQFEAMQTELARLAEGYAAITEKLQQQDTAQMQASLQAFQERSQQVLNTLVESMSTLANIVAKQK
jgi:hypothetical protein